jgi:PilZ domain-containing protein
VNCLEQRERTRYGVRALADFEWMGEEVLRRGQGLTRDISSKGMFIYSDSEPPPMVNLRVTVFFTSVTGAPAKVQLRAKALVVRVEPSSSPGIQQGFAILHRSWELHNDVSSIIDD